MLKRGFWVLLLGVAIAGFWGTAAQAASASSVFAPGLNLLRDDSAEVLLNANGSVCASAPCTGGVPANDSIVNIGDKLVGIVAIHTVQNSNGSFPIGAPTQPDELTLVFSIQVTDEFTSATPPPVGATCPSGQVCFTFGPSATFAADILAASGTVVGAPPAGTMAIFWDDPAQNYTTAGTRTAAFTSAEGGGLFWFAGETGAGAFWNAVAPSNDVAAIEAALTAGSAGGTFNMGLNQIAGGSGPTLLNIPCTNLIGPPTGPVAGVQFCGGGSLHTSTNPNFSVFDQTEVDINVAVPEPSALLLLGSGLVGLGFWRSRRKA